MLYGGINLYSTVCLYFSLQWKIYLLCRCLRNADVVLYPGTPLQTQRNVYKAGNKRRQYDDVMVLLFPAL